MRCRAASSTCVVKATKAIIKEQEEGASGLGMPESSLAMPGQHATHGLCNDKGSANYPNANAGYFERARAVSQARNELWKGLGTQNEGVSRCRRLQACALTSCQYSMRVLFLW